MLAPFTFDFYAIDCLLEHPYLIAFHTYPIFPSNSLLEPTKVRSLQCQAKNTTAVEVSWGEPEPTNGPISAYYIYFLKAPDQSNPQSLQNVAYQSWASVKVCLLHYSLAAHVSIMNSNGLLTLS